MDCSKLNSTLDLLDAKINLLESFDTLSPVSYTHLTLPTTPYV